MISNYTRTRLTKLVNNHFDNVIKQCCNIQNLESDSSFHNYSRLKKIKKGKKTYCGQMKCGITTFALGNILKNNMDIDMYMYRFGYGKYLEDHVFLKYKEYIIDPTYRQFFTDDRSGFNFNNKDSSKYSGISIYNNYLYDLPPFFVGTMDDLYNLYIKLDKLNSEEFEYNSLSKDILDNWQEDYCITERLKLPI